MSNTDHSSASNGDTDGLQAETLTSHAAMDTVFDLFSDERTALVELDGEYRIVRCNRGYAAPSGRAPGDLVGALPTELFDIHFPGGAGQESTAASLSYPYVAREIWLCRQNRRRLVTWLKLWKLDDTGSRRYFKLGVFPGQERDDTGENMDSHVQLQAFLHAAPDAIVTIDDRGRMISTNPATEELFGYRRHELKGRNVSMLMPSPDKDRHDTYLRHYLETGEARIIGIGREIVARRKNGDTFPARLSVSEFEANGNRYFTGMLHDITARIEAEEKLRVMFAEHAHASRVVALGEMASSIAHEINQPLTAIVSYADASRRLIETGNKDADALSHALHRISDQGQRAGAIIRRLREFVRKKEPRRSPVEINELIDAAVQLTSHDVERYGIALEFDLEPESFIAIVDRLQLEQVILNLVRNSIDAINDGGRRNGRIQIGSRATNTQTRISVSDNGAGIKASEGASIFEPFYTTKEKGTGLGLSISRSIVEAHGGTLSLEPNPDNGVTFTIILPMPQHE